MSIREFTRASASLEILLILYFYGPMPKTDLSERQRIGFESVQHSLEILRKLGLVAIRQQARFPYSHVCELAPRGRQLVESPAYDWPSLFWEWTGERSLIVAH